MDEAFNDVKSVAFTFKSMDRGWPIPPAPPITQTLKADGADECSEAAAALRETTATDRREAMAT
jgi:hypothetical protein